MSEEMQKATEAYKEKVLALVSEPKTKRRIDMIQRDLYGILSEPDNLKALARAITTFLDTMHPLVQGNNIVARGDRELYEELHKHLMMLQGEMNNFLRRQ